MGHARNIDCFSSNIEEGIGSRKNLFSFYWSVLKTTSKKAKKKRVKKPGTCPLSFSFVEITHNKFLHQVDTEKKSELYIGFEPTTLCDLVGALTTELLETPW